MTSSAGRQSGAAADSGVSRLKTTFFGEAAFINRPLADL